MTRRLLLIEDDDLVATMLCTMLSKSGFVCDHACDESAAVELFGKSIETGQRYDLVVVDLILGEDSMGGAAAMQYIRKVQPDIVSILCSGFSSSQVVAQFKEHGFDFCLNKPFSWSNLKTILTEHLNVDMGLLKKSNVESS
ncbi:MAG: response regulator [Candidatus Riflebacteria bacterium]